MSFHRCARDNRDQDSSVSAIADLFCQCKRGLLGVSDVQQSKSQGWPRPPPALSTSTLFGVASKDRQHPVSCTLKRRDTREMAILHCKKKWAYKAVFREKRERVSWACGIRHPGCFCNVAVESAHQRRTIKEGRRGGLMPQLSCFYRRLRQTERSTPFGNFRILMNKYIDSGYHACFLGIATIHDSGKSGQLRRAAHAIRGRASFQSPISLPRSRNRDGWIPD